MAKSPNAKTNGHKVPALKTAAPKSAAQAATKPATKVAPKAAAAPKAAIKAAPKTAPKTSLKAAPKTAAKPATKVATKPVTKPVTKPPTEAGVKPAKPVPAAAAAPEAVREKVRKTKLVRDSFTMPEQEYAVIGQVKKACLKAGFEIKKSELLRIGVALISQLDMATLQQVLASLPQLKTGRPKND